RPAAGRYVSHRGGRKGAFERGIRRVRKNSGGGIREWRTPVPRGAISRSGRESGVLHAGREVDEEGVPPFAAEISRADYVALQHAPVPSNLEGISRAPGD